MESFGQELGRLAEASQQLEDEISAVVFRPCRVARGRDDSGTVEVVLEGSSYRVQVSDGWERDLPPEALNAAIAQAAGAALEQRYSEDQIRYDDEPVERARPANAEFDWAALAQTPGFAELTRRDDFPQRLQSFVQEVGRRAAQGLIGCSPDGLARAHLLYDGTVQAVEFDSELARGRRGSALNQAAQQAIEAAVAAFSSPGRVMRTPADIMEVFGG